MNSQNTDERYRVIEKLRAATGDIDSVKLRRILEVATIDYHLPIAEFAQASITILDQYERDLSENAAIGVYSIDTQEPNYSVPANSSDAR